jgi:serine protease Do
MTDRIGRGGAAAGRLLGVLVPVALGIGVGLVLARSGGGSHDAGTTASSSDSSVVLQTPIPADRETRVLEDPSHSRRTAIAFAAQRVGPAVVTVTVTQVRVVRTGPYLAFHDEFFEQFFREYFPYREYRQPYQSMGSGFIVSNDGYILTNDHVVRGAEVIQVTLPDGRAFPARFIGEDATYDIAVLKIDAQDDLPAAPLGRSDDLIIGEWAVAIGNPFGFLLSNSEPTVTAGVISATRRDIRQSADQPSIYKEMIQTDAAINPGNSGGPLVNALGEVIGMNTFIFSKSGGSVGIGFAIPIDTARRVMDELIQYGSVRRVWVGLRIQEITPVLAQYLKLRSRDGVIVSFVEPGSPAEEAGVRRGDVILSVNGTAVQNIGEAQRALFGSKIGDRLSLRIVHEGAESTVSLRLRGVEGGQS